MTLECLLIDDEPIARKGLSEYIEDIDFLKLAGQADNPVSVMPLLQKKHIDLIFLDIHMPKLSGIDFLKLLPDKPMVVMTTAYPQYALEGFDLDVLDYLVKPISFERFLKASQKALNYKMLLDLNKELAKERSDFVFLKSDNKVEKVFFHEIRYVEAMQNYILVHTEHRKMVCYLTFKAMEAQLPKAHFVKVHKSYIISIAHVSSVQGNTLTAHGKEFPLSRNLKDAALNKIFGLKLLKRE